MSKFALKKKEFDLSEESAHEAVMEVLEFYEIDIDNILDPIGKTSAEQAMTKIQSAYRAGRLYNKINDKGEFTIIQKVKNSEGVETEMIYAELRAKHKLAMDGKKDAQNYARMYGLLGSLTNVTDTGIKRLRAQDLSIAECLGFVFLAA